MQVSKVFVRIIYADNTIEEREYFVENELLTIKQQDIKRQVESIQVLCNEFVANAGDDGYFIVPNISEILDYSNQTK